MIALSGALGLSPFPRRIYVHVLDPGPAGFDALGTALSRDLGRVVMGSAQAHNFMVLVEPSEDEGGLMAALRWSLQAAGAAAQGVASALPPPLGFKLARWTGGRWLRVRDEDGLLALGALPLNALALPEALVTELRGLGLLAARDVAALGAAHFDEEHAPAHDRLRATLGYQPDFQ